MKRQPFQKALVMIFCALIGVLNAQAQIPTDSIVVYNRAGNLVTFQEVLNAASDKQYVFFGELHGTPVSHQAESLLLHHLHGVHGQNLVFGMEMFEMDVQPIIDEYFAGLINKRSFETEARIWNNYAKDYEPLVEYARENHIRLIASNVPRRYANAVYHQGVGVLNKMSRQAKRHFPKLPLKIDYTAPSYRSMASMLPDHSAENFIASQALKDATMAMNIDKHIGKKDILLHIHGAYHTTNWEGIIPYVKGITRDQLLLITTIMQGENGTIETSEFEKADYTIVSIAH